MAIQHGEHWSQDNTALQAKHKPARLVSTESASVTEAVVVHVCAFRHKLCALPSGQVRCLKDLAVKEKNISAFN